MAKLKFLFRADRTNVGDWWCPPFRYFKFKPSTVGEIVDPAFSIEEGDIVIVGGGGLGSEHFRPHLRRVSTSAAAATIIWGAGVDAVLDRSRLLVEREPDLHGDYFDAFTEVGTRVFSDPQKFLFVPCASCMNGLFDQYRERKPIERLGVYHHKRVPLSVGTRAGPLPMLDNSGDDLEAKLDFLSRFEFVLTNTYHGVYWATLLNRKVICMPYKSGLMSFKHRPVYSFDGRLTQDIFAQATAYPQALAEARQRNREFHRYLGEKYDIAG